MMESRLDLLKKELEEFEAHTQVSVELAKANKPGVIDKCPPYIWIPLTLMYLYYVWILMYLYYAFK